MRIHPAAIRPEKKEPKFEELRIEAPQFEIPSRSAATTGRASPEVDHTVDFSVTNWGIL